MKKSQDRWDPSTYVADWRNAVNLLTNPNFFRDVLDMVNLPKGASILGFGVGSGKWECAFSLMGYMVTAVDNNPEMLEQVKQNYPNIKIEYVVDELPDLKSEIFDKKYDLVFSEGLVEHFLDKDERISVLRAMRDRCILGGYVLVYVPFLSDKEDEHRYTSIKEVKQEMVDAKLKPIFSAVMEMTVKDRNKHIGVSNNIKIMSVKR